jgi:hypothetical protein
MQEPLLLEDELVVIPLLDEELEPVVSPLLDEELEPPTVPPLELEDDELELPTVPPLELEDEEEEPEDEELDPLTGPPLLLELLLEELELLLEELELLLEEFEAPLDELELLLDELEALLEELELLPSEVAGGVTEMSVISILLFPLGSSITLNITSIDSAVSATATEAKAASSVCEVLDTKKLIRSDATTCCWKMARNWPRLSVVASASSWLASFIIRISAFATGDSSAVTSLPVIIV